MGHAIKLNRPIGRLRIGDGSMDESQLVGGSPADRGRLLERLHDYLDANARFDWETLQDIWSGAQEGVFFNLMATPTKAASIGRVSGSSISRTSPAAIGPRSTSAASFPAILLSSRAIVTPNRTGSAASRRRQRRAIV